MSAAADQPAGGPAFSPKVILALVLVGIVAFAGLSVLSAYAPDLRNGQDGRAHALSKSAIGFAAAPILMRKLGQAPVVSRSRSLNLEDAAVVLTPEGDEKAEALRPFADAGVVLVVMPKWVAAPDPLRRGYVRKVTVMGDGDRDALFSAYSKATRVKTEPKARQPALRGVGGPFAPGTYLPLGTIDRLQTVSGEGWAPALVDETGAMVLAYSKKRPSLWLLADPDLLNNQGLARLANARAGVAILDAASAGGARALIFDVTLNGYERGRGIWRTMLEPPWLAATLIGVAAAILMGLHALARFGLPRRRERAFALGARALVDNSAGLVRMARREHELAPEYVALTRGLVIRAGGGHTAEEHWLEHLAERRGAASPGELARAAEQAKTRDDLLTVARRLYEWRGEMTRERR
jgi:hypothetical protein